MDACIVCGSFKVDRCHIKSKGSGGGIDPNNLILLCRKHHAESHQYGWKKFCEKFPIVEIALNEKGFEFVDEFGITKLRKK